MLDLKTGECNNNGMTDERAMERIADYINNNKIIVLKLYEDTSNIEFDENNRKINISVPGTVEYDGERIYVDLILSDDYIELLEDNPIGVTIAITGGPRSLLITEETSFMVASIIIR